MADYPMRWRLRMAWSHVRDAVAILVRPGSPSRTLATALALAQWRADVRAMGAYDTDEGHDA